MQTLEKTNSYKDISLPKDWKILNARELGTITDGDWILAKEYSKDGVRLIQVGDIGVGRFIDKSRRFISQESAARLKCTIVKQGNDILISRMPEPIGRACLSPILPYPYIVAVDISIFSIHENLADRNFMIYSLNSVNTLTQVQQFISGTTRQRISRKSLETIKMLIPTLPEQRKITSILSSIDELIKKTGQIIEQTERLKRGLMNKLLTRGTGHMKLKKTQIGPLPEHWDLLLSRDLFSYVTSGSRGWAKYYSTDGALFITIGNLDRNTISLDLTNVRRVKLPIGTEGVRTLIRQNDILISVTADVGMVALVSEPIPEAYINQHVALARPNKGNDFKFIAWYLASSDGGLKQFKQLQRGVTKTGLGLEDIKNIWVPVPPLHEQQKISSILDSLVRDIDLNILIKSKLDHLKKGLMQKLLTGKIRVNV